MTIKEQLGKKDVECEIRDRLIKELIDKLERTGIASHPSPMIIKMHCPQPYYLHIGPYYIQLTGMTNGMTSISIDNVQQLAHSSGYLETTSIE